MTNLADSIAIEHSIADALLKSLSQGLDPNECAFHLERRAVDFFQNRLRAPNRAISPVILEAIATFATAHPNLKPRALSSLLVLAAASVASWNSVAASKIFELHPDLYELLSRSIAKVNPCLHYLAVEVISAISTAFVELSDFETYEKHDRLRKFPVTPASLAVKGCFGNLKDERKVDSSAADLLTKVLCCLPLKALESIPDEDWARALDLALEANINEKYVSLRTLLGLSRDSPARAEMLRVVRKRPESSLAMDIGRNDTVTSPQTSLASFDKIFSSLLEINTAEKAYQLVRRSCAEGDDRSMKTAASKWLSAGKLNLVAGAYLAAPAMLSSLVDNNNEVFAAMKELPGALWSPVDETMDNNLADLLSTVPELSRLLARRNGDNGKSAQLSLKRLALMHPFLVARRLECLSSACRTALHGLTNCEERYERPCLRVFEVVFEVICTLPVACLEAAEIESLSVETLEFLLEENRVENGVPDMFSDLATAIFKSLARLQGNLQGSRCHDLIAKVRQGANTSMRIKEAAETLLHV